MTGNAFNPVCGRAWSPEGLSEVADKAVYGRHLRKTVRDIETALNSNSYRKVVGVVGGPFSGTSYYVRRILRILGPDFDHVLVDCSSPGFTGFPDMSDADDTTVIVLENVCFADQEKARAFIEDYCHRKLVVYTSYAPLAEYPYVTLNAMTDEEVATRFRGKCNLMERLGVTLEDLAGLGPAFGDYHEFGLVDQVCEMVASLYFTSKQEFLHAIAGWEDLVKPAEFPQVMKDMERCLRNSIYARGKSNDALEPSPLLRYLAEESPVSYLVREWTDKYNMNLLDVAEIIIRQCLRIMPLLSLDDGDGVQARFIDCYLNSGLPFVPPNAAASEQRYYHGGVALFVLEHFSVLRVRDATYASSAAYTMSPFLRFVIRKQIEDYRVDTIRRIYTSMVMISELKASRQWTLLTGNSALLTNSLQQMYDIRGTPQYDELEKAVKKEVSLKKLGFCRDAPEGEDDRSFRNRMTSLSVMLLMFFRATRLFTDGMDEKTRNVLRGVSRALSCMDGFPRINNEAKGGNAIHHAVWRLLTLAEGAGGGGDYKADYKEVKEYAGTYGDTYQSFCRDVFQRQAQGTLFQGAEFFQYDEHDSEKMTIMKAYLGMLSDVCGADKVSDFGISKEYPVTDKDVARITRALVRFITIGLWNRSYPDSVIEGMVGGIKPESKGFRYSFGMNGELACYNSSDKNQSDPELDFTTDYDVMYEFLRLIHRKNVMRAVFDLDLAPVFRVTGALIDGLEKAPEDAMYPEKYIQTYCLCVSVLCDCAEKLMDAPEGTDHAVAFGLLEAVGGKYERPETMHVREDFRMFYSDMRRRIAMSHMASAFGLEYGGGTPDIVKDVEAVDMDGGYKICEGYRKVLLEEEKDRPSICITPEREATSDFRYGLMDMCQMSDTYEGHRHLSTDIKMVPDGEKLDYFEYASRIYIKYAGNHRNAGGAESDCDTHLASIYIKKCRYTLMLAPTFKSNRERREKLDKAVSLCRGILSSALINDLDPVHISATLVMASLYVEEQNIYDAEQMLASLREMRTFSRMSRMQMARYEETFAKFEELKCKFRYYGDSFGVYRTPLKHYVRARDLAAECGDQELKMLIGSRIFRLKTLLNEEDSALKNELIAYISSKAAMEHVHVYTSILKNVLGS